MKKTITAIGFLALTACSNGAEVGPGLLLDAATTSHILSNPAYRELNPLVINDPVIGPIGLIAMNYAARSALIEVGYEADKVNLVLDTGSMFAGVHNLAFFASQSHPIGIVVGGLAAFAYYDYQNNKAEYTIEATSKTTGEVLIQGGEFLFYTEDDCNTIKNELNDQLVYKCVKV